MLAYLSYIPVAVLIAGFIVSAIISERSMRGIDEATVGRLMKELAHERKVCMILVPIPLAIGFVWHDGFWPSLSLCFLYLTIAAARKLQTLDLPGKIVREQTAAVGAVCIGACVGWAISLAV